MTNKEKFSKILNAIIIMIILSLIPIFGYLLDSILNIEVIETSFKLLISAFFITYFYKKSKKIEKKKVINKAIPCILITLLMIVSVIVLSEQVDILYHLNVFYVIATAIYEELFYRKYLLDEFEINKFNVKSAFFISILFGISHVFTILLAPELMLNYILQVITSIILGIIFIYIYFKTNENLYLLIEIHFIINYVLYLVGGIVYSKINAIDISLSILYLIISVFFTIIFSNKNEKRSIDYI